MSMESLSHSQCAVIHPRPGIAEAPWKRLKSEPKRPLEGKPEEDDEFNDLKHQNLNYFDADIHLRETLKKEEIQKKIQKKQGKGGYVGRRGGGMAFVGRPAGGMAFVCVDDSRTELIEFSKLALQKYNAKTQNQGEEMFKFHDIVKANRGGYIYYITFRAKKAGGGGGAIFTFLAKVRSQILFNDPPQVMSCFLKPT